MPHVQRLFEETLKFFLLLKIINTHFVGKFLLQFDKLPSTNTYAQELLSKSEPKEGTVILTFHQTHGRGQAGNQWYGDQGLNIALSAIFFPHFLKPGEQFLLVKAASLAVVDLISPLAGKVFIKWPNDIFIDGQKVCGILIQNVLNMDRINSSIIGIGLNVNQVQFPPHLTHATSLRLHSHKEYVLDEVAEQLLICLEKRYIQLSNKEHQTLGADYRRFLYRRGMHASFLDSKQDPFDGTIEGVSPEGKLIIQTGTGKRFFNTKEVTFVPEPPTKLSAL